MNIRKILAALCAMAAGYAVPVVAHEFEGTWLLRISDLEHKEVVVMEIQFAEDKAPSCNGGSWKKIVVVSAKTSRPEFFPVKDPLSHRINGGNIIIGRNEVCDGYLSMSGWLMDGVVKGSYSGYGIQGGNLLGYFELGRKPK